MATTTDDEPGVVLNLFPGKHNSDVPPRDEQADESNRPEPEPDPAKETDGQDEAEFTDARLTYRLNDELAEAGKPVAYTSAEGWLQWDGRRWRRVDDTKIIQEVLEWARDWHDREVFGKPRITNERAIRLRALLRITRIEQLVRALRGVARRDLADFDQHPDLLNTPSGVVDLRTGELRPHDPALLLTMMTGVPYVPGAKDEHWERAKKALPEEERAYVLARLGQAITGHLPDDDKTLFAVGGGANGKSTFFTPVYKALGNYAGMAPQGLLLGNPNKHETEFMVLRGRRLAWIEETPEAGRINTQRLKTIVGTEAITARHLYKDFVTFEPQHTLIVSTNHPPFVEETDHGTWRRLEMVRFPLTFRPSGTAQRDRSERRDGERPGDPNLRHRLKTSKKAQEAVLAEVVANAVQWYRNGRRLPEPPVAVREATEAWRAASDVLVGYFTDNLVADPSAYVSATELLADVNKWLDEHGLSPWSERLLTSRLTDNEGIPAKVSKGRRRAGDGYSARVFAPKPANPIAMYQGIRFKDGL